MSGSGRRRRGKSFARSAVAGLVLFGLVVGWQWSVLEPGSSVDPSDNWSPSEQAASPSDGGVEKAGGRGIDGATEIESNLAKVRIVSIRTRVAGYDRSCSPGRGCVFGPPWTDDQDAPGGRNGCGTRDDVLGSQLRNPVWRAGSRCVVVAGTLQDPYTGRMVEFAKAEADRVQVDHLFPLAAAWDLGAWQWSHGSRVEFANDVTDGLIAVAGDVNREKGDRTPGEWLPPNLSFRCEYIRRYLRVAIRYGLAITAADVRAARLSTLGC